MTESRTKDIPWTWSDVWVFVSVMGSRGAGAHGVHPATLEAVIETADYINRAIISCNELDGGLARLLAAGLISFEEERIAPTPAGDALYSSAKSRSFWDKIEGTGAQLGLSPPIDFDPTTHDAQWTTGWLTPERMSGAVASYRRDLQRRLDELRKREGAT